MSTRAARVQLQEIAAGQGGVVTRAQAAATGVDRGVVARQVAAGSWQVFGRRSIAPHSLPLGDEARRRVAAWEAHPDAALDGVSSLQEAGLQQFDDGIHVLCRWPHGGISYFGSRVHNSRLWDPEDIIEVGGVRRTRNDVAAVRAALWARTDRAAALVLAMSVQQRLVPGDRLLAQAERINRHKRRPFVLLVAKDIAEGAHALGELDFAALCRKRNLPEPDRQSVRRNVGGRWYRDAYWDELGVVVEIEGVHHDAPQNVIDDALRQNSFTVQSERVLRIPLLGLRVVPDRFLDQVELLLVAAGWRRAG